jgi:tRNA dimethylallyltransferase
MLVAIVGPTGAGKSALAMALAEHLPVEIVSADSRTVYRWMDIGTAKPTEVDRQRVPHHVLDVVDPDEAYTLAHYQRQALAAVERIQRRGRVALLVGGAGLYVSAVCDGLVLPDVPPDEAFRAAMFARASSEGWPALQQELAHVDPESARRIEPRNVRRVIRALEVHRATGRPFSSFQVPDPSLAPRSMLVGLQVERAELNARLDVRIDAWMQSGFVDEVRALLARGYARTLPSMSGLGYREVASFVAGERSLDSAVASFKQATHQYAKRQMTWFGRDPRIRWLSGSSPAVADVLDLVTAAAAEYPR